MPELTEQQKVARTLRINLRDRCASARREAAVFAALTVLLTPLAVALFILALLFAVAFVDLPVIDYLGYRKSFLTGLNLCLAFMGASYFLRPKEEHRLRAGDSIWLLAAAAIFCGILALSYFTPLATDHPVRFWVLYLILALVMLGCIGHSYEPHDDYYLGWTLGPVLIDDPFTFQDDIDRAHIGLGFAASLSHLILGSYGAILGNRWLWQGLLESHLAGAVAVLQGLAAGNAEAVATQLQRLDKRAAADLVRALVKLELVDVVSGPPKLSMKGREFLAEGGREGWRYPDTPSSH